jgi:hypothetical protein
VFLAIVVGLGGCPSSAPPIPSKIPSAVQCKITQDASGIVQTISWGSDSLVETAPTLRKADAPISIVLSVGGQPYVSVDVAADGKGQTATARFGKAFSGMRQMVLATVDGETLSGTLDGRPLKPFARKDPPSAFADGSPLPKVSIDDTVQRELAAFLKAMETAPHTCKSTASSNRPLFADAVPFHHYNPENGDACLACEGVCIAITAWGVAATAALCAGTGYGYGACITAGILFSFVGGRACRATCLTARPGPCCPSDCGNGTCCASGDTCGGPAPPNGFTPDTGPMCCPADHPQTCGRVCCRDASHDRCNLNTSTCCPVGSPCCQPNTTPCGTQCCLGRGCNLSTGQCCALGQATCGTCGANGQPCCTRGTACGAGSTCSSGTCRPCPSPPASVSINDTPSDFWGGYFWGHNCLTGLDFTQDFGHEHCDRDTHRDQCTATVISNNDDRAFCRAAWKYPNDPTSCLCAVHVQVPTNCNGGISCNVTVTVKPSAPPTPSECLPPR